MRLGHTIGPSAQNAFCQFVKRMLRRRRQTVFAKTVCKHPVFAGAFANVRLSQSQINHIVPADVRLLLPIRYEGQRRKDSRGAETTIWRTPIRGAHRPKAAYQIGWYTYINRTTITGNICDKHCREACNVAVATCCNPQVSEMPLRCSSDVSRSHRAHRPRNNHTPVTMTLRRHDIYASTDNDKRYGRRTRTAQLPISATSSGDALAEQYRREPPIRLLRATAAAERGGVHKWNT